MPYHARPRQTMLDLALPHPPNLALPYRTSTCPIQPGLTMPALLCHTRPRLAGLHLAGPGLPCQVPPRPAVQGPTLPHQTVPATPILAKPCRTVPYLALTGPAILSHVISIQAFPDLFLLPLQCVTFAGQGFFDSSRRIEGSSVVPDVRFAGSDPFLPSEHAEERQALL